jgi:acyl dehydratase
VRRHRAGDDVSGRYLEDFTVGEEIVTAGRTVTEEAIIAFATLYDPQYFHIDVEAARESPFGGLIASGFLTLAIGFRLFIDTGVFAGTSQGSPGMDQVRWLLPVRPGDTLHTIARVVEVRPSASKPERGILRAAFRILNQRGEDVMTIATTTFLARRPAGGPSTATSGSER